MLPEIKKQFEEAQSHAQQLRNENASLIIQKRNVMDTIEQFEAENQL